MTSSRSLNIAVTVLFVTVLALLTLGLVMLASTDSTRTRPGLGLPVAQKQAVWLLLSLGLFGATACFDYRRYRRFAWEILGAAALMLLAVLLIGRRINGAARWLVYGPVQFQPSEFAKYALVLFLAFWLEKAQRPAKGSPRPRLRHWWWGVFAPLAVAGGVAVLVLREPDRGTALLLLTVAWILLWMGGAPAGWLIAILFAAALVLASLLVAIFKYGMFHEYYQVQRLIHWWLGDDLQGSNHQQHMAMVALGSGGLWGRGLGNSRMKWGFLPEAHTDFILPVIGEELGLLATLAVVLGYFLILVCGVVLANRAPDAFGRLLGCGIVVVIGLQAVINIAVVTNLVPNKGMPLPFISYGGSGLLMALSSLGVLLNISWQGHRQGTETL